MDMDKEIYEPVQTTRSGEKVLRRRRRLRGIRHFICQGVRKIFKGTTVR